MSHHIIIFPYFQINEFVHKRTVTRRLITNGVTHPKSFQWLTEMRFYFDPRQTVVSNLNQNQIDCTT